MNNLYFMNKNQKIERYEDLKSAYLNNPTKKRSWKEGFSAESLAKYWFHTEGKRIKGFIEDMFGKVDFGNGFFEYCTKFDEANGPREHDLCFPKIDAGTQYITLGIEAKCSESYDKIIVEHIKDSQRKIKNGETTQKLNRIQSIYLSMEQPNSTIAKPIEDYFSQRYQLFTGLVGTIAEARLQHSQLAIFFIIQFETNYSDRHKIVDNKNDLTSFLKYMNISNKIVSGQIINISKEFKDVDFFKIEYESKDIDIYIGYLFVDMKTL
ncbi:MAG: hypothetical protein JXL85_09205 [Bacilli bacterium]|nr:hypothetical protein [Bacilli bacterium]